MRKAMERLLTLVAEHHSTLPSELIHAALELGMAINRHALLTAPAATLPFVPQNGTANGVLVSATSGQRSRLSVVAMSARHRVKSAPLGLHEPVPS